MEGKVFTVYPCMYSSVVVKCPTCLCRLGAERHVNLKFLRSTFENTTGIAKSLAGFWGLATETLYLRSYCTPPGNFLVMLVSIHVTWNVLAYSSAHSGTRVIGVFSTLTKFWQQTAFCGRAIHMGHIFSLQPLKKRPRGQSTFGCLGIIIIVSCQAKSSSCNYTRAFPDFSVEANYSIPRMSSNLGTGCL